MFCISMSAILIYCDICILDSRRYGKTVMFVKNVKPVLMQANSSDEDDDEGDDDEESDDSMDGHPSKKQKIH